MQENLTARIEGNKLIIECDIPKKLERSKKRDKSGDVIGEGPNDLIASSKGNWKPAGVLYQGQQVTIGLNAFMPHVDPPPTAKKKTPAKPATEPAKKAK